MEKYEITISPKEMVAFTQELFQKFNEIEEYVLDEARIDFYFEQKSLLFEHMDTEMTEKELEQHFINGFVRIQERVENPEGLVGILCCEGDLYERLYAYVNYGSDDEGHTARALYQALERTTNKYGITYEWGGGCITLYDAEVVAKILMSMVEGSV